MATDLDEHAPRSERQTARRNWNLQQVLRRQDLAEILFLVIQYQNRRYMGAMRFDDDAFCQEIYALLQSQLGLSIKEIGDVDVSHLP